MHLPFRLTTYGLIGGGLALVVAMSAIATKAYHDGIWVGLIGFIFLVSMSIISGVALIRQRSPRLCLVNFLLIAVFTGLLSAAFVYRRQFIIEQRMTMHIFSLERALQKEGVPFKPFADSR